MKSQKRTRFFALAGLCALVAVFSIAGLDRNVTHIRWSFAGNLSHITPNNTGAVSFTVRIR